VSADGEADLIGRTLGAAYRVDAQLGKGGMGSVYAGSSLRDGGRVALKVLHPRLAMEEKAVARFEREARLASALQHPHVVRALEIGRDDDGTHYIVMEHLEGRSMSALIRESGRVEPSRAVRLTRQVLSGLAAAHTIGIVHRDVKPGNVMVVAGPDGRETAKLVDFGIARLMETDAYTQLTQAGQVIGTPTYMPPEQAMGDPVDARADVYAAGALLFAALTGKPPFGRGNWMDVISRLLKREREPLSRVRPDLPELARVVERAMEWTPSARYGTAQEMSEALAALEPSRTIVDWEIPPTLAKTLTDLGVTPQPKTLAALAAVAAPTRVPTTADRTRPPRARLWLGAILVLGLLVGAAVTALLFTMKGPDPDPPQAAIPSIQPVQPQMPMMPSALDARVPDAERASAPVDMPSSFEAWSGEIIADDESPTERRRARSDRAAPMTMQGGGAVPVAPSEATSPLRQTTIRAGDYAISIRVEAISGWPLMTPITLARRNRAHFAQCVDGLPTSEVPTTTPLVNTVLRITGRTHVNEVSNQGRIGGSQDFSSCVFDLWIHDRRVDAPTPQDGRAIVHVRISRR